MRRLLHILVLGSVVIPLPAAAQAPDAASNPDDIVVEGKRIEKREIDQFVRALTDTPGYGQISRFEMEVCPRVAGLRPQQNEAVARRISAVAAAAGAQVGKSGCRPNTMVLVTRQPWEFLRALREKYPALFNDPIGQPVKLSESASAIAWHVEGRLTQDDLPATVVETGMDRYYMSSTMDMSRLNPSTRPHFLSGVLVLDVHSLGGLTPIQVADYATMRLLARTDPARLDRTSAPTILSILEAAPDSQVPVTLTNWDFSYLKALYGSAEHRFANHQRSEMQRSMRKDLQRSKRSK